MTHAAALLFTILAPSDAELLRLEKEHLVFALRDAVMARKDNSPAVLLHRGLTRTRFGDMPGAERDLKAYLRSSPRDAAAHRALSNVFVREFKYDLAAKALAESLKLEPNADAANSMKLWTGVAKVPRQTVRVERATSVPLKRTIGLRVPLDVNGKVHEFIFDTGANLSVLSESKAKELGIEARSDTIEVGTISGIKVPARVAEMPTLRLGSVVIQHAIALVMPDSALTIPNTTIRLDAILGFPVIAGLREFSISRDGTLTIPAKPSARRGADMALDGLTPLVQAAAFGKVGTYSFDTGASLTVFWPPFFREHEATVRQTGTLGEEPITGAGGTRKIPAWAVPSVALNLGGKEVRLVAPKVLTEPAIEHSNYLHGNLGQDLVRQFDRLTINFDRMWLAVD